MAICTPGGRRTPHLLGGGGSGEGRGEDTPTSGFAVRNRFQDNSENLKKIRGCFADLVRIFSFCMCRDILIRCLRCLGTDLCESIGRKRNLEFSCVCGLNFANPKPSFWPCIGLRIERWTGTEDSGRPWNKIYSTFLLSSEQDHVQQMFLDRMKVF